MSNRIDSRVGGKSVDWLLLLLLLVLGLLLLLEWCRYNMWCLMWCISSQQCGCKPTRTQIYCRLSACSRSWEGEDERERSGRWTWEGGRERTKGLYTRGGGFQPIFEGCSEKWICVYARMEEVEEEEEWIKGDLACGQKSNSNQKRKQSWLGALVSCMANLLFLVANITCKLDWEMNELPTAWFVTSCKLQMSLQMYLLCI